jgi:hypothetical protein
MITTKDLAKRASSYVEYWDEETVFPNRPYGLQDMPKEWEAKFTEYKFGPSIFYKLNNVHLAGPNLAGFLKDDLILDVGYYGRFDLWERNDVFFKWALDCLTLPAKKIPVAMSMAGVWSGNYFHWMIDHLPTLMAVFKAERMYEVDIPVILHNSPSQFIIDSLNFLEQKYIVNDSNHYVVENLIVPTWPREDGFVRPSSAESLRTFNPFDNRTVNRPIHISRRNATSRRLTNEEEVTELLESYRAETLVTEKMPWKAQQMAMSSTNYVIGPHGAGLINALMCERGTRVIELVSPTYTNPCCWLAATAAGIQYSFVVGSSNVGGESADYSINPTQLRNLLEDVLI